MNPFVERHEEEIGGVLPCFDRVVITGTLPDICHPKAMAGYLRSRDIRLFDYARWAEPLRDEVRANAERLAAEAGLEIEFIRKLKAFRKEARVQSILSRAWPSPRSGPYLLRHGGVFLLSLLVRQGQWQDPVQADHRQLSALLLLKIRIGDPTGYVEVSAFLRAASRLYEARFKTR